MSYGCIQSHGDKGKSSERKKTDSACTLEGSCTRHCTTSFTPIQCILKQAPVTVVHTRLISARGWAGRWPRSALRGLCVQGCCGFYAQWSVWLVVCCNSYCQATTHKRPPLKIHWLYLFNKCWHKQLHLDPSNFHTARRCVCQLKRSPDPIL